LDAEGKPPSRYGDPAYVNIMCSLHPMLWEAVAKILTTASVRAADALEEFFTAWTESLEDAADPTLTAHDRVVLLDDAIHRLFAAATGLAGRAFAADPETWRSVADWASRCADAFRLDLAADVSGCDGDLDALAAAHADCRGDHGSLGAVPCPELAARQPAFVTGLRAAFRARVAARDAPAAWAAGLGGLGDDEADGDDVTYDVGP